MGPVCDLVHMNFLTKRAVNLINGCHIEISPTHFTLIVTSVIPWFKITESYPLDGSEVEQRRRDLRGGGARGAVRVGGGGGVLDVRIRWEAPYPGTESCVFSLVGGNKLVAKTKMRLNNGGTASYTQVYYRET